MDRTRFGLTAHQQQLFDFVYAELSSGKVSPSFEQMREHLGLKSRSNVHRLVEALVERGWLVRLPYRARSLALPGHGSAASKSSAGLPLQVEIPPVLAHRLQEFCAVRRRSAGDVVQEALAVHLRWPA